MGLRPTEILLIMAVLLLLFGASRLPQLGSSLGSAIRNFKKGFNSDETPEDKGQGKGVASLTGEGQDKGISASQKSGDREG